MKIEKLSEIFILICWEGHSFFVLIIRHYDGLSISVLQKAREPGGFSIYIIKSNTKFNKELNTTMLTHSQEGLVPETYADIVIGWIKTKSI